MDLDRVEKKLKKKTKQSNCCFFCLKKHSELFLLRHARLPFSEVHNNNLLCLSWHMAIKFEG